ncbi:hypothetical protein F5Y05DRAFT_379855 [Hypoxylon sp. FL0543]|nr:hypothetical protein F5Y05DRAFT_379855 [Hypoxylon sp. FL0543]
MHAESCVPGMSLVVFLLEILPPVLTPPLDIKCCPLVRERWSSSRRVLVKVLFLLSLVPRGSLAFRTALMSLKVMRI